MHPVCGNCERYGVDCFYDRIKPVVAGSQGGQTQKTQNTSTDRLSAFVADRTSRHLLELRLMHHFTTQTVDTLPTSAEPGLAKIWREKCVELAIRHPALLDSICAIAALHITLTEPSNNLFDAHCQYMDSALRGHRHDISDVNISNVDAVWFTSSLLRTALFIRLQYRDTSEPYQLPEEWLSLIAMVRSTFLSIWSAVRSNPEAAQRSVMVLFRDATMAQRWWTKDLDEEKAQVFPYLIERVMPRDQFEPWDPDICEAYMYALAALGNLKESADSMRLVGFLGLLPTKYSQLILERQPRALVIFAHYFAFMAGHTEMWMIGKTPQKEITGIASLVPGEWQPLMQWPLSVRDSLVSASTMAASMEVT